MAIARGLCTVKQVEQNTCPDEPYGPSTTPPLATVEAWIDEDIDLLYPLLYAKGIITPVVNAEVVRVVAVIQAKRVAARIENFLHYTTGQVGSTYGSNLSGDAEKELNSLLNDMKLPADAVNNKRKAIPNNHLFSKFAEDLWDSSKEDTVKREPMFKIGKEF